MPPKCSRFYLRLKKFLFAPISLSYLIIMLLSLMAAANTGCMKTGVTATGTAEVEQTAKNDIAPGQETSAWAEGGGQIEDSETEGQETSAGEAGEALIEVPAGLNADIAGNFTADGIISDDEYSGYNNMDGFIVYWANDSKYIYVAMKAITGGFVSIGIQPGQAMKDADIILGFVESTGVSIYDMFSTGNSGPHPYDPELGGTDDILDFDGSEQNGCTTIEFQRMLSTGDEYDNEIVPGTNKIIWAYGDGDSPEGTHLKRGYGEIEIK